MRRKTLVFSEIFGAFAHPENSARSLGLFCLALFFLLSGLAQAAEQGTSPEKSTNSSASEWIHMPAGAKSAYMGIHGGTMPVSLLVAQDGSALLSFVGRTGNDFLNALAKGKFAMPSFGNATLSGKPSGNTNIFAGNSTASLPVFAANGNEEEWLKTLAPFGFSVAPLAIEGQPDIPPASPRARKYRNFYLPGSLRLKK